MANLTWRNKVQPTQTASKSAEEIIKDIATKLAIHVKDGVISLSELDKIKKLAADTSRLKGALNWL